MSQRSMDSNTEPSDRVRREFRQMARSSERLKDRDGSGSRERLPNTVCFVWLPHSNPKECLGLTRKQTQICARLHSECGSRGNIAQACQCKLIRCLEAVAGKGSNPSHLPPPRKDSGPSNRLDPRRPSRTYRPSSPPTQSRGVSCNNLALLCIPSSTSCKSSSNPSQTSWSGARCKQGPLGL